LDGGALSETIEYRVSLVIQGSAFRRPGDASWADVADRALSFQTKPDKEWKPDGDRPWPLDEWRAAEVGSVRERAMSEQAGRWRSVKEIADHLGIKQDTAYLWIRDKGMPAHRVGRLWKFQQAEVDRWVKSGKAGDDQSTR